MGFKILDIILVGGNGINNKLKLRIIDTHKPLPQKFPLLSLSLLSLSVKHDSLSDLPPAVIRTAHQLFVVNYRYYICICFPNVLALSFYSPLSSYRAPVSNELMIPPHQSPVPPSFAWEKEGLREVREDRGKWSEEVKEKLLQT